MSADLLIDQICPHEVTDEALYVSADRKMVRPLRPISSAATVKLFLNHGIQVPSPGVVQPARVLGSRRGPFTITAGVNDLFELNIDQQGVQRVTLPAATKQAALHAAGHLNRNVNGATFSVVDDALVMTSWNSGRGASIYVGSASTAAPLFGIITNHEYRGSQTVPGWTLINDPLTLSDRPTRVVVFDEPLRGGSDFVELTYTTVREECRRCGGTGVENDWRYDNQGAAVEVRDEALLLQELQKYFFTIIGSNPFHNWYGTSIVDAIGKKMAAGGLAQNLILSDLHQGFYRWQAIKRQEEDAGIQISDEEFPFRLLSLNVQASPDDPTIVYVQITVQNRASDAIDISRGYRLPSSFTLPAGTIRQSLSNYTLTG